MDRYCRICRNTSCSNHGKDITFLGEGWKCNYIPVPTNADRIRAMTDEELAQWIYNGISTDPCDYCDYNNGYCDGSPCSGKEDAEMIGEWLKKPAEVEA